MKSDIGIGYVARSTGFDLDVYYLDKLSDLFVSNSFDYEMSSSGIVEVLACQPPEISKAENPCGKFMLKCSSVFS